MTVTPDTCSPFTLLWWTWMGPWRDADNQSPTFPLLNYMEAIGSLAQETENITRDTPTHDGWSVLLDADNCPAEDLPWLAQLAGAVLPPNASEATMRTLIKASGANNRGTPLSITQAVQAVLGAGVRVDVNERVGGDAYQLGVVTYLHDTPGGAGGSVAAQVKAAIIAVKPAGIVLTYSVQSGLDWAQMVNYPASTAGRWVDQTDTWASLSNAVPV